MATTLGGLYVIFMAKRIAIEEERMVVRIAIVDVVDERTRGPTFSFPAQAPANIPTNTDP